MGHLAGWVSWGRVSDTVDAMLGLSARGEDGVFANICVRKKVAGGCYGEVRSIDQGYPNEIP